MTRPPTTLSGAESAVSGQRLQTKVPLFLLLLIASLGILGCETITEPTPDPAEAHVAEVALNNAPHAPGALFERAWGGGEVWELVKPRPPGLGADPAKATPLYVIAPVDPADPLSPAITIPDVFVVGGRDHIAPASASTARGAGSNGIARTVALQHPNWYGGPPFDAAACAAPADDARIAWAWVQVGGADGHPCGQVAFVYAVQLEGESCPLPLTDEERVRSAIDQGLVLPFEPDEGGPWPYAIRPLSGSRGAGGSVAPSKACVPGGERMGG